MNESPLENDDLTPMGEKQTETLDGNHETDQSPQPDASLPLPSTESINESDADRLTAVPEDNTSDEIGPTKGLGADIDGSALNLDNTSDKIGPTEGLGADIDGSALNLDTTILSTCNVCHQPAIATGRKAGRTGLLCSECKLPVHYACTRLPPYELHNHVSSKKKKKYTCEVCADTPETFLTDLIASDIINVHKSNRGGNENEEAEKQGYGTDRMKQLESKMDALSETIEKYNLSSIADRMLEMYTNMNKTNRSFTDATSVFNKTKDLIEKLVNAHQLTQPSLSNVDDEELNQRVKEKEEQMQAMRAAESLLNRSIVEKDKIINTLFTDKQKHIGRIDELHGENQRLSSNLERLLKIEEEKIWFQNELEKTKHEVVRLNEVIGRMQRGKHERENELELQCRSLRTEVNSKQQTLEDLQIAFKGLETSIAKVADGKSQRQSQPSNRPNAVVTEEDDDISNTTNPSPKVVIYHDSLCKPINDTIMVREKVEVKKIWAPTLSDIKNDLPKQTEPPSCIVIQALTREVDKKNPADYVSDIISTVEMGLTKTEKIVLCLIVDREDSELARNRVKAVNGLLQVKYMDNPNVFVCEHDNLRDPRNRKSDKLHLNDMGTAKLATNLKYKIAEALGITVVRKKQGNSGPRLVRNENKYSNTNSSRKRYTRDRRNFDRGNQQHYDDDRYDDRYDMYGEYD